MNRQLLEKPFEPNQIKQRKGSYGSMLDYVETHAVIQRLNDAFDGEWNFEITTHEQLNSEVVVLGKLTAQSITKMQFGSNKISVSKQGEVIGIGDDLKSAASDCLKKCATLLGIGLHLYGGDTKTEEAPKKAPKEDMSKMSEPKGNNQITKEQLAQVKKLRTAIGWTPKQLQDTAERMFATREIEKLNNTMGTALIAYLQTQGNGDKESEY